MLRIRRVGIFLPSSRMVLALSICMIPVFARAALVDRVLVIRNILSPVSQAVATDYMTRRGATHVLDIRVPDAAASSDSETIDYAKFHASIEKPLRTYLASHPGIDFILMTKGVPIRLEGTQRLPVSLDSYVAALGYDSIPGAIRIIIDNPWYIASDGGPFYALSWYNRFRNSDRPFSHAAFGGYLVTRLDGYTQADAIALTTRSLAAEAAMRKGETPRGNILLDQDPDRGYDDPQNVPFYVLRDSPPEGDSSRAIRESNWGDFNSDMALAGDVLAKRGCPYALDTTENFLGHLGGLMGYASWGSNDIHFNYIAYNTLGFDPGAIAETAVSTSARTFLPRDYGQSLIADLIRDGVTGVKGYVDEPWMQAIASPTLLFGHYTEGWTLAESFYTASNEIGWMDIVIGDPILRAYPFADTALQTDNETTALERGPASGRNHSRGRSDAIHMGTGGAFEFEKAGFGPINMLGRKARQE